MSATNKNNTIVHINKYKNNQNSSFTIFENKMVKHETRFCREIFRVRPISYSRQNQTRSMPKF